MKSPEETLPAGWHLKREIQLGHLITTITVALSALGYIGSIEKRVALLETAIVAQHERDERQDKLTSEAVGLLRGQLQRMDDKLDRLLESRRGKP